VVNFTAKAAKKAQSDTKIQSGKYDSPDFTKIIFDPAVSLKGIVDSNI